MLLLKYACAKYSKDGVRILGIDVLLSRVVVGACHIRKHYRVIVVGYAAIITLYNAKVILTSCVFTYSISES